MIIGITGGIGSGKSYVARLLNTLYNIPVYDCDREARRIMVEDTDVKRRLCSLIGDDAYTADGRLNKPAIAQYLFASANHAAQVNAIVHPAVKDDFIRWAKELQRTTHLQIVAVESAILIEAGFSNAVDHILAVEAPADLRIARAMQRDTSSHRQVSERMAHQMTDEQRRAFASFVVVNDGRPVEPQLNNIIQCLAPS
ncbi:MAG: dephospho-CoA kinase [Bacteroidaceae bacterium]|nr:dephospho-CoA kinase [Bacteroidaceae bacterium]